MATCTAVKHGTANAYRNHHCRCDTARVANTRYNKLRRAGLHDPGWVSSLGVVRRRQALAAIGYGLPQLVPHLGVPARALGNYLRRPHVSRATFGKWSAVYDRLCMTPGPGWMAANYARRMGWAPPLAWDDIDDPTAVPDLGEETQSVIDLAEVVHLERGGCHITEIARRMGVSVKGIEKARSQARRAA